MANSSIRRAAAFARTWPMRAFACWLGVLCIAARADEFDEELFPSIVPERTLEEPAEPSFLAPTDAHGLTHVPRPDAAELGPDEPADDYEGTILSEDKPPLRPFDWMRHWGFHHSSTEGPFLERSVPMEGTSWLNRPYHVDWFLGPLMSDGPVSGRVAQSNGILGGFRLGWDFDYYWGLEWRFGWSDPTLSVTEAEGDISGEYLVSDVDFIYYPWGDTKVRPYFLAGLGLTQIDSVREDLVVHEATLLSMPLGLGVQFPQTHWLAWRLEIIDNLAFGGDGVDTMNNFAFTAGMELRLGARPNSYWPWRSSRTVW